MDPTGSPGSEGGGGRPRLLVVDDDERVRKALSRTLGRRYDVTAVATGEAALAAVGDRPFDAAIVDYEMPGMNGVELVRRLAVEHPGLARIMLTGYAELPEIVALKREELAVAVLMKPWEPSDLEHAISVALRAGASHGAGGPDAT